MDYVLAFLIFGSILATMVFFIYDRHLQWEQKKKLGFMKRMPEIDDCIEARRQLIMFLNERYRNIGRGAFDDCRIGMDTNNLSLYNSHDVVDLIRYVHFCGCHIVIEPVSDKDVESPRVTREVLEKFHTDLDIARDERIRRKYSRR